MFNIVMIWLLLAFLGATGDKEYLLLGNYGDARGDDNIDYNSGISSDEESGGQNNCIDREADDSSSSTDVDVVVQEYKEKVQVCVYFLL